MMLGAMDRTHAATTPARAFRSYKPRLLSDVVDMIWDWDVADADAARRLAIRQAPGTTLLMIAPYRAPISLEQGGCALPTKCAMQVRASSVVLRPTGSLGVIVVGIKPEAAERVVHAPLGPLEDAKVSLPHLFGRGEAATCDELLAAARTSAARIATVEAFLLRRLRPASGSIAARVAAPLRPAPPQRVRALSRHLHPPPRPLGRVFQAAFAMSPKQFARLARIERVVHQRQLGLDWADIAYGCGLADQAHLIREFKALVGVRPTDFFAKGVGRRGEPDLPRPEARTSGVMSENFNSLTPRTAS